MSKPEKKIDIPETFYCPITHELMIDPVIDSDGISYERSAIEEWLKTNPTSPITRKPLSISQLRPNRALRDSIEDIRKRLREQKKEIPKKKKQESNSLLNEKGETKIDIEIDSSGDQVVISLKPPEGKKRCPLDIVCVVDVSGSMSSEATMKDDKGNQESHGLSLLDVVKHAVKTIIKTLGNDDRLSIVTFTTTAKVEFGLIKMDNSGKNKAIVNLERLTPESQTNLWDGLYKGLEVIRKDKSEKRNSAILLFTDGMPNVEPPRGHLPMLQRYIDQNKDMNCTINMFGFGYAMDSKLLNELSQCGKGYYGFIPDSSFTGTIFVNAMSNMFATFGTNVVLNLEPLNGAKIIEKPSGGFISQKTSWGYCVDIGGLYYGQSRELVVKMKLPDNKELPYISAQCVYDNRFSKEKVKISKESNSRKGSSLVEISRLRLKFVDVLEQVVIEGKRNLKNAQKMISEISKDIKKSKEKDHEFILALLKDVDGQATEACSKQAWFDKWGKHYLPSLRSAHQLQICNNFKDPGVQIYGGKIFKECRDIADDIFINLPPPKPSITRSYSSSSRSYQPIQSMASYYNSGGVCIDGNCKVLMSNGKKEYVKNIKKGDFVMSTNGEKSEVLCVLKTEILEKKTILCRINNLLITPWHPIKIEGKWVFPSDIAKAYIIESEAVYSFVLKSGHIMTIEGIETACLGHGFKENDVIKHEYLGTEKVVEDLKKVEGWKEGLISIKKGSSVKRKENGLISKITNKFVSVDV